MEYLEELPQDDGVCPPEAASEAELEGAYRVVYNNPPTLNDFLSHKALGQEVRPGVKSCIWSACSLFLDGTKAKQIAGRLPKSRTRNPHLALVNIPEGSGKSIINERTFHVSFWMYKDFDFQASIVGLEEINVE